nr:replication protein A 70 kDa DNA-binding subunit B [Tanacetum cinerariifolium]
MFRFEPLLQDGICYVILNFGVNENGEKLPLLPHDWKLLFYKNTNVTRTNQIDDNFTGFKSEPFTQLLDTNEEYKDKDVVDVIGTVVGIGEIIAVNSIGSKRYEGQLTPNVLSMQLFITSNTKAGGHTSVTKSVAEKLNLFQPKGHLLLGLNRHGGVPNMRVENKLLIAVYNIQYESGWAYLGYKECSRKVKPVPTKRPSNSRTKQTWWCTKHESREQVADCYKMIVRVMDKSGFGQLCIFDGNMHKMSGFTAWELVEKYD